MNSSFETIGSKRELQEADSCDLILECSTPDEKPTLDSSYINYVDVNQSIEAIPEYGVCDVKIENNDPSLDEKPIVDGALFGCQH